MGERQEQEEKEEEEKEEERQENEKSEAVICLDLISMPIAARGSRKDVTWTSLKESPASVDKRTALMHGMLVTLIDLTGLIFETARVIPLPCSSLP